MLTGSGLTFDMGSYKPKVSEELREQIEKCVDDEAMFALIEDDKDNLPIYETGTGVIPLINRSGGIPYATGGYIPNQSGYIIPANVSPVSVPMNYVPNFIKNLLGVNEKK